MRAFAISATSGKEEQVERLFLANQELKNWPAEIRLMTQLRVLDLSDNYLEEVPAWLSELSHLQQLDLSGNPLVIPPASASLPAALERLEVRRMNWEALPPPLFQLPQLKSLDAAQNQIKHLDKAIGQAIQLEELILDGNALRTLPRSFQRLTAIRKLALRQNRLKRLPAAVAKCRQLRELYLEDNQLSALPAKALSHWDKLEVLSASRNRIRQLPTEIVGCSMLRKLDLAANRLKQLPLSLAKLAWLAKLDLSNNNLQQCPAVISQCKRLRQLSLAGNQMKKLGKWTTSLPLEALDLSRNQLSDVHTLHHLSQLKELQLQSNKLQKFGPGFWNFPQLIRLSAQRNPAKIPAADLLSCPRLVQLEGLLTPAKSKQLLHFLSLAAKEAWGATERNLFFSLYQGNKEAWQTLAPETAWQGVQLQDPYFADTFRRFLFRQSARKKPLKRGGTIWIVGEVTVDLAVWQERIERSGGRLVQTDTPAVSHIVLGIRELPSTLPSLDKPWLSEAQLMQQLDRLEGKKWTQKLADDELGHLRALLLHGQAVNCHLALQMLRGSGLPQVLLTDLLALYLMNRFPALQEKLRSLLFPYLPDVLKMVLGTEQSIPEPGSTLRNWKDWLGTRVVNAERLMLLMK